MILAGPNGVGKTMIAQNLIHAAVLRGYIARLVTASELLNDLAAQEGSGALGRRLARVCEPACLRSTRRELNQVFPNASCVVALVDRLVHRAEVVQIEGTSYRLKEAKKREARGAAERSKRRAGAKAWANSG